MDFIHALNECPIAYVELSGFNLPGHYGYEVYGPWGEIMWFASHAAANRYRIGEIRNLLVVLNAR